MLNVLSSWQAWILGVVFIAAVVIATVSFRREVRSQEQLILIVLAHYGRLDADGILRHARDRVFSSTIAPRLNGLLKRKFVATDAGLYAITATGRDEVKRFMPPPAAAPKRANP